MIPLLKPDFPAIESLTPLFAKVLASGTFSNFGPMVAEFERLAPTVLFDRRDAPACCVTTASGTAALEIAIQALDLPPRSRVIVPAFGFAATACAVARLGHVPEFVDADDRTWEIDRPAALQRAHETKAAAIMAMSPFGYSLDVSAWAEAGRKHGIAVIADVAAAAGNQRSCADIPLIFSMHATKALGVGEGGFIATTDAALATRLRSLTNFGMQERVAKAVGGNAKLSEWHAAIALAQLARWDEIVAARHRVRRDYESAIGAIRARVHPDAWSTPVPAYMPVRLASTREAEAVVSRLTSAGIECRRWFRPMLPAHPAFAGHGQAREFPVANSLADTVVCLPFFSRLSAESVQEIGRNIRMAVG